jgi:GNAT superfamily N-acetyltransferase
MLLWAYMQKHETEIVDATVNGDYGKFLFSCFVLPFRNYRLRQEYLNEAMPKGFRKKVLLWKGEPSGMIEYAPPEAAGYPISGRDIIVVNCIWVLRKAKGHGFGRLLMHAMMEDSKNSSGYATIGLKHWSPWFKVEQLEKLGFRSIDSINVKHKIKHTSTVFTIHLMWLPRCEDAEPPTWDKKKMLEGVNWCMAHPLYHPQSYAQKEILAKL